jgi:hypothetical protein
LNNLFHHPAFRSFGKIFLLFRASAVNPPSPQPLHQPLQLNHRQRTLRPIVRPTHNDVEGEPQPALDVFTCKDSLDPRSSFMHKKLGAIALLLALVTASFAIQSKPAAPDCVLSDDDYNVFSAVINDLGRPEDPEEAWKGKEILVSDLTVEAEHLESKWGPWGFRSNSNAAPAKETEAAFKSRALDLCHIEPKLHTVDPHKLVDHGKLEQMFKKGGWDEFYRTYPNAGGFWDFSHPGYNKAQNEAVLYVGHYCGGLCGTGHLFFLVKDGGQWRVKNRLMLWIS